MTKFTSQSMFTEQTGYQVLAPIKKNLNPDTECVLNNMTKFTSQSMFTQQTGYQVLAPIKKNLNPDTVCFK